MTPDIKILRRKQAFWFLLPYVSMCGGVPLALLQSNGGARTFIAIAVFFLSASLMFYSWGVDYRLRCPICGWLLRVRKTPDGSMPYQFTLQDICPNCGTDLNKSFLLSNTKT